MASILVVDPNEAFATLLVEELRQQSHDVTSAPTFDEAVTQAEEQEFELALLDMGLEAPGAVALAKELRVRQPDVRLMLIPLMGEDLPEKTGMEISVQGVLPKPFFLPELPARIEAALEAPVVPSKAAGDVAPSPVAKAQPLPPVEVEMDVEGALSLEAVRRHRDAVERMMDELAQEVGADVVLLSIGEHLALAVGRLDESGREAMAQAVYHSWAICSTVGQILGREQAHFEQSLSGGNYVLYALSLDGPAVLAVAIQGTAVLGLVRHRARKTASAIRRLFAAED
ncbi:MAG: response regulator transcription factor [Anaerolineae bacterium]